MPGILHESHVRTEGREQTGAARQEGEGDAILKARYDAGPPQQVCDLYEETKQDSGGHNT